MNKEEIDAMMSRLPSQQHGEPLWSKVLTGILFFAFVALMAYAPDIYFNPEEITCVHIPKDYD